MQEGPPPGLTPFVFLDPAGKRWPRLRLLLVLSGLLFFVGTILFVQTLFVAPQLRVPFSLRQLKGQLKSLQKENPAGQVPAGSLLWQKFGAARQAAKKPAAVTPAPPARPRRQITSHKQRAGGYMEERKHRHP